MTWNYPSWRIPTTLLWFFVILVGAISFAHADIDPAYEPIKARYFKLRNNDPKLQREQEWRAIIHDFEIFVRDHPHSPAAPQARINQSIIFEKLSQAQSDETKILNDAAESIECCKDVVAQYSQSDVADDCLIRLGDLYANQRNDPVGARAYFQQLVDSYSNSDLFAVATARIQKLDRGSAGEEAKGEENHKTASAPAVNYRAKVVIDPGHGAEDYGATGVGQLLEKDVVLSVALKLEKLLKQDGTIDVVLTRRSDLFVPLAERTAVANDAHADLFISLHTNASPAHTLQGLEVFTLDNTDSSASKVLADRENQSLQFEGQPSDLQFMLSDLIQDAKLPDSIRLAHHLRASVLSSVEERWGKSVDHGVRKAPFYVLVGAHMPCVLVELYFIDHRDDGERLSTEEFRNYLAQGLFHGIVSYLDGKKK